MSTKLSVDSWLLLLLLVNPIAVWFATKWRKTLKQSECIKNEVLETFKTSPHPDLDTWKNYLYMMSDNFMSALVTSPICCKLSYDTHKVDPK